MQTTINGEPRVLATDSALDLIAEIRREGLRFLRLPSFRTYWKAGSDQTS